MPNSTDFQQHNEYNVTRDDPDQYRDALVYKFIIPFVGLVAVVSLLTTIAICVGSMRARARSRQLNIKFYYSRPSASSAGQSGDHPDPAIRFEGSNDQSSVSFSSATDRLSEIFDDDKVREKLQDDDLNSVCEIDDVNNRNLQTVTRAGVSSLSV